MTPENRPITPEQWILKRLSYGKTGFSLSDLRSELFMYSAIALKESLKRLSKKGRILSIHKGYYLIIPPQYASRGMLPASNFLDDFMKYLQKPYYVALLSAAAMHGAAHQQPQEFYVITTPPALRPTFKRSLKINYVVKNEIPESFLIRKRTETGRITVSCPELTALDLIWYERRAGGLERVSTVLSELIEEFDLARIDEAFVTLGPATSVQRLGFMLENVVDGGRFAEKLFDMCLKAQIRFYRIPLVGSEDAQGFSSKNRWNVIENYELLAEI